MLGELLDVGHQSHCGPHAQNQHAFGQRIERTGMPHLDGSDASLDHVDDVARRHSRGFIAIQKAKNTGRLPFISLAPVDSFTCFADRHNEGKATP